MIVNGNPCFVFPLEHFYNGRGKGIVDALRRSMDKRVPLLSNSGQMITYVGVSQGSEVGKICRVESDFIELFQPHADKGIPPQGVFQEPVRNMSKAVTKESLDPSFKVSPK